MKMHKTPDTKKCIGCGNFFTFVWFKSYCSEKCRLAHAHYSIVQSRMLKCKNCGKEFRGKFARKYCEKKCSNEFFRKKARAKKQLKEIGQYIGGTKKIGY